ncbi:hypothetical protein E4P29_11250 [Rhodococcus sp. 1R11]|uniref:hypothetical protein n=1 Tax=Rhodococcus sp. 1R11 TaxID=2559614 RepID=UPI0010722A3D|nr:hypothetical protein [Rhodococcus sp. 1R11]TFI43573.1 hypothetical protein E4P29_11250 [Rhodococcus sp. 1R11]
MEILKYGVGWFIGIVALIAGAYYFFYNKRRKSIEIESTTRSMILAGVRGHGQLTVAYDETRVRDPYIVELAVVNSGHKDITSNDFDANKPLRISVEAKAVALLQWSVIEKEQSVMPLRLDAEASHVVLGPSKLAVGEIHRLRLLVDGTPHISVVENPLIDTKIEFGKPKKRRKQFRQAIAAFFGFGLLVILQVSNFLFNSLRDKMNVVTVDFAGSSRVASPWGAALWAWINTFAVVACFLLIVYAMAGALTMLITSSFRSDQGN